MNTIISFTYCTDSFITAHNTEFFNILFDILSNLRSNFTSLLSNFLTFMFHVVPPYCVYRRVTGTTSRAYLEPFGSKCAVPKRGFLWLMFVDVCWAAGIVLQVFLLLNSMSIPISRI